jgi:hypothetical protein
MQQYVSARQRKLPDLLEDAWAWDAARSTAAAEAESDWSLLQRLASQRCSCSAGSCQWAAATRAFFERNQHSLDEDELLVCVAAVMQHGPSKTSRVPMLVGPSNAGKSTVFDPVDKVFGAAQVFHTPALGSSMPLANLATTKKRFLYLDDYRPVEFAALPSRPCPTVPVPTFLKLLGGQHLEVAVSQSFNNGNIDLRWQRGVVITAKADGIWDRISPVTAEDIRHMQSRVHQFCATAQLQQLREVPACPEGFSSWLVHGSARAAVRGLPRHLVASVVEAPHLDRAEEEELEVSFF